MKQHLINGLVYCSALIAMTLFGATQSADAAQRAIQALGCDWSHMTISAGSSRFRAAGVNGDFAAYVQASLNAGNTISAMAVAPNCNGGLIVMSNGAYIGRGLNLNGAAPVYNALDALKRIGRRIEGVAFDPHRWSSDRRFIIIHDGGFFAGGGVGGARDANLIAALNDAADNRGGVASVAFAPRGTPAGSRPSGWTVVAKDGVVTARGIGGEAPSYFSLVRMAPTRGDLFVSFAPDRSAPFYRWTFGDNTCHQGSGPRIANVAPPQCVAVDQVEKLWRGVETELRAAVGVKDAAELLTRHKAVGATIVMIDAGRRPVARHYGQRNRPRGLPTDKDTLYPAASMTKMVAGLTFAIADDRGELSLNRTIDSIAAANRGGLVDDWRRKVFTGFRARRNGWSDWPSRIDIARLLRHRAALGKSGISSGTNANRCRTLEDLIMGRKTGFTCNGVKPLRNSEPGQERIYSGGGYLIAEAAYEEVNGQTLSAASVQRVLRPAGMGRSFFWNSNTEDLAIARGCFAVNVCPNLLLTNEVASATGLVAHPEDFARLVQILMMDGWDGRGSRPKKVFTTDVLSTLFTGEGGNGYGLGVWYRPAGAANYSAVSQFFHGGTESHGIKTSFIADRASRKAIVLFINGPNAWKQSVPKDRGGGAMRSELEAAFRAHIGRPD